LRSNSDTDCNSDCHNNSYGHCYRDGDSDGYRHHDSYCNSDGYRDSDRLTNSYCNSDGDCQRDGYADTSAYTNCQTCPHVETSPVSAAPAVEAAMRKRGTRCPQRVRKDECGFIG
jgi:hypothetical protein